MPGPIVRPIKGTEDKFEMVSVGPTTSMRMEKFEKEFIAKTGVKLIVGKGGMAKEPKRAVWNIKPCTVCSLPAVR